MDLKISKTIAYCYRAVSQNYWVNRALETYDAVFFAMTDLRMPKDPNKPDIVELESRILYSASPFSMWNGLDVAPEPTSLWDFWTNFGSVSGASSLLLTRSSRVRFIPNGNNGESATFTYRAWDQTSGTASINRAPGYADSAANGGTTAYSSLAGSVQCFVTSVNDAPVLSDTALSITIAEDSGVPSGVVGSLVSSFTGSISDVDSGSVKGIAITASVETNGTW